jgi:Domain of unknown function (DUF5107)
VFQVDLWMPRSAAVLLARVRIRNPNDSPTPMYWWTNAAITVAPDTRVIAPAARAFRTEYPTGLRVAGVPDDGDHDVTFPSRHLRAADFFFDIATEQRPWIVAVDGSGAGIAHVSTGALRGRKLFVWGTGRGGRRWQHWLSHGGDEAYAEIQAGLAPTQFEYLTMPARAEWSWTEAFAPIAVDTERSHSTDWRSAVSHVGAVIDDLLPSDKLEAWHHAGGAIADRPPTRLVATGSGWGALERQRRHAVGATWLDEIGTPFADASLGADQEQWLELLHAGRVRVELPACPPRSYVVGGDWEDRLSAAPVSWLTDYLLAVMAHGRGDRVAATARYESSLRRAPNAWALRGLAEAARADGRPGVSADYAVAATRLSTGEWRLAAEAVARLLDADRPHAALALIDELPADVRGHSRLRLLEAWAAHHAGDVRRAAAILDHGLEVADLREGERSLDRLWNAVFPDRDVPADYDFRMAQ